jgi:rubrerythrin
MEKKETIWICTNCGYSASKPFETDICPKCHMTFWKCGYCACTLISATAPELCPECDVQAQFQNITCYIPDWEDHEHLNSPY